MKKELTIGLLTVALTIGLASTVTAQDSSQETNVTVDVSGVTQLDVRPSSLSYTDVAGNDSLEALEPGQSRSTSDGLFSQIEVENIGSERIGNIYGRATMPTQQPFGTDVADGGANHSTGNFVTVSLDTANEGRYRLSDVVPNIENPHHLNRVEYFEENPPTYIQTESDTFGGEAVQNQEVGRFRVGGAEYFFVIYETDASNGTLVIGDTPHTPTEIGTTDFTDGGSDYSTTSLDFSSTATGAGSNVARVQSQEFVKFNTSSDSYDGEDPLLADGSAEETNYNSLDDISGTVRTYDLYVSKTSNGIGSNDGYILRSKFNVAPLAPDEDWTGNSNRGSGALQSFLYAGNENEALQPGENFPIDIGVQVPLGVDQNGIEEGTVTIVSDTF